MKRQVRAARGSSIVELASTAFIMSFMTIFCINVCVVLLGIVVNDQSCRDAARAASRGHNVNEAFALAQAAVNAHSTASGLITQHALTSSDVTFDGFDGDITQIQSGTSVPCVTVRTTSTIKVPAPQLLFGAQMSNEGLVTAGSTYTFPVTSLNANIPGESP